MNPTCQPYADALVDEGAPRPSGLSQHLATCTSCRALRSGHRGAQLLLGSALPPPPRVPLGPVVRRAALALVVGMLAAIPLAVAPDQARPAPEAASAAGLALEQPPLQARPVEADDPQPLVELAVLSRTVSRYARANPVAHGYGPRWRNLPVLLAPARSLHPAVLTPEQ